MQFHCYILINSVGYQIDVKILSFFLPEVGPKLPKIHNYRKKQLRKISQVFWNTTFIFHIP